MNLLQIFKLRERFKLAHFLEQSINNFLVLLTSTSLDFAYFVALYKTPQKCYK
jgi:hypothetical protein